MRLGVVMRNLLFLFLFPCLAHATAESGLDKEDQDIYDKAAIEAKAFYGKSQVKFEKICKILDETKNESGQTNICKKIEKESQKSVAAPPFIQEAGVLALTQFIEGALRSQLVCINLTKKYAPNSQQTLTQFDSIARGKKLNKAALNSCKNRFQYGRAYGETVKIIQKNLDDTKLFQLPATEKAAQAKLQDAREQLIGEIKALSYRFSTKVNAEQNSFLRSQSDTK